MSESSQGQNHRTIRTFFRLVIIIFTWGAVSLKPDSESGFFVSLFVVSMTSFYEYVIIFIDSYTHDNTRAIFSSVGMFFTLIYFIGSTLGLWGCIKLNLSSMDFSFTDKIPIAHAEKIYWSYYPVIYFMLVFPAIIVIESFLKRIIKTGVPSKKVA